MNRVGHAFFKGRMRELNAVFGGEVTGHYYFRDNFYCDNGFIPALLILELMSKKQQSLKQMLEPLRAKYFISGEINTKMPSMDAMSARRWPRSKRGTRTPTIYEARRHLDRVSGLAFQRAPSNTEPLLRLNLEGTTAEQMERSETRCCRLFAVEAPGQSLLGQDRRIRIRPVFHDHAVLRSGLL